MEAARSAFRVVGGSNGNRIQGDIRSCLVIAPMTYTNQLMSNDILAYIALVHFCCVVPQKALLAAWNALLTNIGATSMAHIAVRLKLLVFASTCLTAVPRGNVEGECQFELKKPLPAQPQSTSKD